MTDTNKLLSDFMEIPTMYVEREYNKPDVLEIVNPDNPNGNLTGIPYQPDKDWNQLMDIVDKIETLIVDEVDVTVEMEHNFCTISGNFGPIYMENETKRESTYNAVVKFVIKYKE